MFSFSNWSVLTVNFLVVLYLALGGVTLCAVLYLVGARWRYRDPPSWPVPCLPCSRWLSCC